MTARIPNFLVGLLGYRFFSLEPYHLIDLKTLTGFLFGSSVVIDTPPTKRRCFTSPGGKLSISTRHSVLVRSTTLGPPVQIHPCIVIKSLACAFVNQVFSVASTTYL